MARRTPFRLLLVLASLLVASGAHAGLHTFHWSSPSWPSGGTLTLNVPGVAPGQPFDDADGPFVAGFRFGAFSFVSETALSASSSGGGELDSGSAVLEVRGRFGLLASLSLSFGGQPALDEVVLPAGTESGHWRSGVPNADTSVVASFVHRVEAETVATHISHPALDGRPAVRFVVSKAWNPGLVAGVYDDTEIFIWYDPLVEQWAILHTDLTFLPAGSAFNVLVPSQDERIFRHTAEPANTEDEWTQFSSPLTSSHPDALVLVTHVVEIIDFGAGDPINDHPLGVAYSAAHAQWGVTNQDLAPMAAGTHFNAYVVPDASRAVVHTAGAGNTRSTPRSSNRRS